MRHVAFALWVVVSLFLAGCTWGDSERAIATAPDPAASPTPQAVAEQPTPRGEPTATPDLDPIPDPAVTATPRPAPTPDPAVTATPRPAPAPTADNAGLASESLDAALALSALRPVECPEAARVDQVACSLARLPLRADDPDPSEMIELMVATVDNGGHGGIGPVVFLQGGPGVGIVSGASRFVGIDHDVILVDQRGAGSSEPKLACPEVDVLWLAEHTDDDSMRLTEGDEHYLDAHQRCRDRLASEGINFDDFNTEAAADDIALLRLLLGHESWSLWGSSYGTRVALTIMRDHPEGIRAAVLDSVVPLEVDFFATIPENGLRAIAALDQACDATSCTEHHGDFRENLASLTRQLSETPAAVTVTRPSSGEQFQFRVDGAELLNIVFTQLYNRASLPALPRQVSRSGFGGLDELVAAYVRRRDPERLDLAIALYYATWCREEFPFHDEVYDDELLADMEVEFGVAFADAFESHGLDGLCGVFDVESSTEVDDETVSSTIPTLVFAGAFDPITPPQWSRQVADALDNATYVELPDHGHGMITACPRSIRVEFLRAPHEPVDLSCVDQIGGPDFE